MRYAGAKVPGLINWPYSADRRLETLFYSVGGGTRLMLIDDAFSFAFVRSCDNCIRRNVAAESPNAFSKRNARRGEKRALPFNTRLSADLVIRS